MSDTTKERPGEAGPKHSDQHGEAIARAREAVIAKHTLRCPDCERWSREYARQADELAALKTENERLRNVAEFKPGSCKMLSLGDQCCCTLCRQSKELATLKARLAEVEFSAKYWGGVAFKNAEYADVFRARLADAEKRAEAAEAERDKCKRIDECNQGTIDAAIQRAEIERLRAELASAKLAANVPSTFTGTLAEFIEQDNFEDAERFKALTRAKEAAEGRVKELEAKAIAASECYCTPLEDAAMLELRKVLNQ